MPVERSYCIAIRTLGKAGEKYQKLLNSILHQTIQPQKVLVYIPFGYDLPSERIGNEIFVRCEKGMVAQRSLQLDIITTDYCLFCDDDISFPANFVEKLFHELLKNDGDCISPDSFRNHLCPIYTKILNSIKWASPRKPDKWAFKINKYTSSFSYNNAPQCATLKSQSAAFPCFLCKMEVFRKIHFEDERWLDSFSYASGDDQLFFYKMFLMGFKLLVNYDSNIEHLDGKTSRIGDDERQKYRNGVFIRFCLWYRSCFKLKDNRKTDKLLCMLFFASKLSIIYLYHIIWSLSRGRFYRLTDFFSSLSHAYKYVHSEEYLKYPSYDFHIQNKTK